MSNSCDVCDKAFFLQNNLKQHTEFHNGKTYRCDDCSFTSMQRVYLKRHIKNIHEGTSFLCNLCEYNGKSAMNLKRHRETEHGGVKHECKLCSFSTIDIYYFKQHKKAKHEENGYACDQCDYDAGKSSQLSNHRQVLILRTVMNHTF